uniref:VASP tetramerisation domain-containing protein n=1 Tax=Panagrolaimus sp. JU765 TaxID=591449 RepID=A0AC34QQY4_9BILA
MTSGDAPVTRPWQKPNGIQGITSIAAAQNASESPKALRKLTGEPTSPTVSVEYLNQFKQEVLAEVRQEIAKAKQDIINAIRELGSSSKENYHIFLHLQNFVSISQFWITCFFVFLFLTVLVRVSFGAIYFLALLLY